MRYAHWRSPSRNDILVEMVVVPRRCFLRGGRHRRCRRRRRRLPLHRHRPRVRRRIRRRRPIR